MTRSNRSWLFFTVSTAALAASSVLVGMTNHKPPTPVPAPEVVESKFTPSNEGAAAGFTTLEMEAKNILTTELNRRFTDRQNVDFGMSRIVRPGTRMHFGPTMDRTGSASKGKKQNTRPTKDGRWEFEVDGTWYSMDQRKPLMSAENDSETRAMSILRDAKVDVAIYTIGHFEMDKGEKPERREDGNNPNPNYRDFNYDTGESIRVKGPAYIHQDSAMAPRTYELVNFGRRAWASKQTDYIGEGKDGWVYFAHRVDSNDASCARCHGDRKGYASGKPVDIKGAIQKPGDPVGLFVIALRRVDAK